MKLIAAILFIIILNYGCDNMYPKKDNSLGLIHPIQVDTVSYDMGTIRMELDTPIFHIKVVNFGSCDWFQVIYTNDNFVTKETINEVIDLTMGTEPIDVIIQRKLFTNQYEAVYFAKQFKSYTSCIKYNEMIGNKYGKKMAYYMLNPPKKSVSTKCYPTTDILIR